MFYKEYFQAPYTKKKQSNQFRIESYLKALTQAC